MGIHVLFYPQEPPENTINTMGTLLGVHPIVPWFLRLLVPRSQLPSLWTSTLSRLSGRLQRTPPLAVTFHEVFWTCYICIYLHQFFPPGIHIATPLIMFVVSGGPRSASREEPGLSGCLRVLMEMANSPEVQLLQVLECQSSSGQTCETDFGQTDMIRSKTHEDTPSYIYCRR